MRHRKAGVCIVLATHNVLQAKRIADTMVILHDGVQIEEDSQLARSLLAGEWSG